LNTSQGSTLIAKAIKYNSSALSLVDSFELNWDKRAWLIPVRLETIALFTDFLVKYSPKDVMNLSILLR
jgi:hypothetical protein